MSEDVTQTQPNIDDQSVISAEETVVETPIEEVKPEELVGEKIPDFRAGDTVKVFYKIIEGKKERIQPYEGLVIAMKGSGVSKTFTVRKIGADNVGVERILPLNSPNIVKIQVLKKGDVRRAKLYYIRDAVGKAAMKIKEKKAKPVKTA